MKPHLPLLLRKTLLAGVLSLVAFAQFGVSVFAESQDLIYQGTNLTWDTSAENKAFVVADGETTSAFAQGDNIRFTSTSDVTLGENITVGTISIEEGADVTLNQQNYSLTAEKIAVSGTLDMGESLYVGSGTILAIESSSAVLKSNLTLSNESALSVNGSASLNNNTLILHGGTDFSLSSIGDGCRYDIFSNVSKLMDAEGNTISLDSTNNKAALYFDATQPGTGFWADSTLQLTEDGTLQLVRYTNIAIPSGCTSVLVTSSSNIESYSNSTSNIAFKLKNDIILNGKTGSILDTSFGTKVFTSNSYNSLASIEVLNSKKLAFKVNSLTMINLDTISMQDNKNAVTSTDSSSTYAEGGAIHGYFAKDLVIQNNGTVSFQGNNASALNPSTSLHPSLYAYGGGITWQGDSISIEGNGTVSLSNNKACADSKYYNAMAHGGAIHGSAQTLLDDTGCDIVMNNNACLLFSGNTASATIDSTSSPVDAWAYGGAISIEAGSSLTFSNNGKILFQSNNATALAPKNGSRNNAHAYGGAISLGTKCFLSFDNNAEIVFSENTVSLASSNAEGRGGAIYGDAVFNNNGKVIFHANRVDATKGYEQGGAIYGDVLLNRNNTVQFSNNYGGAVHGSVSADSNITLLFIENERNAAISGSLELKKNHYVLFKDNNDGVVNSSVTMTENKEVIFQNNSGGTIKCLASDIMIDKNENVIFCDNEGGAIYTNGDIYTEGKVLIKNNTNIAFTGNNSYGNEVQGGAIYAGLIILDNNTNVIFSNNSASCPTEWLAEGGAIYLRGNSSLAIQNNGSVLFEKNAEIMNDVYRLRSIYAPSATVVNFAARSDGEIRFNDSIYIGKELMLNKTTDNTILTGDIIFSGEYTELHLNELLANNENRQSVTLTEIENSRTSVVNGKTTLYGGTLKVESKAILQLNGGLEVTAEGNATVQIKNAIISANSADIPEIVMNSGRLELSDEAKVLGANITIAKGATLAAVAGADNRFNTPVTTSILTLSSDDEATSEVFNAEVGGIITGNLTLQAGSTLAADGAHFVFGDDSELNIEVNYSEKVHLWLTEGVEYGDENQILLFSNVGSLTITVDGEILDYSNGVLATTVFDGDWVNDDLMLYIDDSNVFVKNVNLVPEPTTATLSLLALAGLAARRRRK